MESMGFLWDFLCEIFCLSCFRWWRCGWFALSLQSHFSQQNQSFAPIMKYWLRWGSSTKTKWCAMSKAHLFTNWGLQEIAGKGEVAKCIAVLLLRFFRLSFGNDACWSSFEKQSSYLAGPGTLQRFITFTGANDLPIYQSCVHDLP